MPARCLLDWTGSAPAPMMPPMPNNRAKGVNGEREAAHAFQAATGIPTERAAQYCGKHGDADLRCKAPLHLESKRLQRIAILKALRQAERDAAGGKLPVAIIREDGDTEWSVVLRVRNVVQFAEAVVAARAEALL